MAWNNDLGKRGEDIAAEFLKQKGYKILERNWKSSHLELDIIALKDDTIAFVEVKTRTSDVYFRPEQAVNYKKQSNLTKAANHYYNYHHLQYDTRFDIISILFLDDDKYEIEHIKEAFTPMRTRGGYRRYGG